MGGAVHITIIGMHTYNTNARAMVYRKDLFEEAGIDPESIGTWDDLMQEGMKATGGDRYMTCYDETGFDYSLQSMIFSSEGTGFYDSEDNIVVDSEENLGSDPYWFGGAWLKLDRGILETTQTMTIDDPNRCYRVVELLVMEDDDFETVAARLNPYRFLLNRILKKDQD